MHVAGNHAKKAIKALEENKTWTFDHLPVEKRTIHSKWLSKIKYKPIGEVER